MRELLKEECAYIAGIVDGEGTIMVAHMANRFALHLLISNTCRELLDWLVDRFECEVYTSENIAAHHKIPYSLCLTGTKAKKVIEVLLPYLIVKQKQAQIASSYPVANIGSRLSEEDKLLQALAYIQLRKLNKKGRDIESEE